MAKTYRYHHPIAGVVEVPANIPFDDIDNYILEQASKTVPEQGSIETFFDQFGEGFMSSAMGASQILAEDPEAAVSNTYEEEFLSRLQLKQNPISGYSGLLLGSIADPVTIPAAFLKPLTFASKVGTVASRGAVVGGAAGALEPTYEEFGDSRAFNVGAGTVLGGALGAGAGKLMTTLEEKAAAKAGGDVEDILQTLEEPPVPNFKTADEIKEETFRVVETDLVSMAANKLAPEEIKAINGGKAQIQKLIQDTEEEITRFSEFTKKGVPPTQKQKKQNENYLNELTRRLGEQKDRLESLDNQLKLNKRYEAADTELRNLKGLNKANAAKTKLEARVKDLETKLKQTQGKKIDAKSVNALEKKLNKTKRELDAFYARTATPTYNKVLEARLAENAKRKADYEQKLEAYKQTKAEQPVEQAVEPTPVVKTEDDLVNEYSVRTGLEPRGTSAGSAEARPSAVYAPEAAEGVDTKALVKSVTTRAKAPESAKVSDEGFDLSPTERQRQAFRRMASKEQIEKISGVKDGKYTFDEVSKLAKQLETKIGKSYDSLMEFVQERVDNRQMFNAVEMEILQPLFDTAEQAIPATMTKIRKLIRANNLDSQEGLEAIQDLQFYNYIGNIRLDQRAQASAALRGYGRMKNVRKGQETTVKKGKPVDNVFLGLKC